MKRRTAPECIGFFLGWDMRDVSETRYQRYNPGVYVIGDDYMCCPPQGVKPPNIGLRGETTPWVRVGEAYGRAIYRYANSPDPTPTQANHRSPFGPFG